MSDKLTDAMSRAAGTRAGLGRAGWVPPSRRGKKGVLIHVEPEVSKRLKVLAAQRESSVQALGVEALERLLDRYGA